MSEELVLNEEQLEKQFNGEEEKDFILNLSSGNILCVNPLGKIPAKLDNVTVNVRIRPMLQFIPVPKTAGDYKLHCRALYHKDIKTVELLP